MSGKAETDIPTCIVNAAEISISPVRPEVSKGERDSTERAVHALRQSSGQASIPQHERLNSTALPCIAPMLQRGNELESDIPKEPQSGKASIPTLERGNDLVEYDKKKMDNLIALEYGATLLEQNRTGYGFPVYGSNGVVGYHSDFLVKGPGIIIGRKGSMGEVSWSQDDFWPIDTSYYVRPQYHINLRWLFWTLKNANLTKLDAATGVPGLNRNDAYNVQVHTPSFEEQIRISYILDIIESEIEKTEALIAKLKQVRAGMLHDLLTCGVDENGEIRDPEYAHKQFVTSQFGLIPKTWKLMPLSSLCIHIGSGLTPRGGQDVYKTSGIMFIRSQNITFEGLLLNNVAYISEEINAAMKRSEIIPYDVLFNITGASIGRCCHLPAGFQRANVNQHVCALRLPNATSADAVVLSAILGSSIGQRQLDVLLTVGNRQGLNYQQLGSFLIPWPSESERLNLAEIINEQEQVLRKEENAKAKLLLLCQGLSSDLLTGQVRIPLNFELA